MERSRGFFRMFADGWLTLGPFVPIYRVDEGVCSFRQGSLS